MHASAADTRGTAVEFLTDLPQRPSSIDHLNQFHGLPVLAFPQVSFARPPPPADPASVAWRLQCGPYTGDEASDDYRNRFTETVPLEEVRALVIGSAGYGSDGRPADTVDTPVGSSSRLVGLEALFLAGPGQARAAPAHPALRPGPGP
ncbi:hypothetical protein GCM10027162_16150 [Streptomyces incanus]